MSNSQKSISEQFKEAVEKDQKAIAEFLEEFSEETGYPASQAGLIEYLDNVSGKEWGDYESYAKRNKNITIKKSEKTVFYKTKRGKKVKIPADFRIDDKWRERWYKIMDNKSAEEERFHAQFDPETVKECKNPPELAEWIQREIEYVENAFSNPYLPDYEERVKNKYKEIIDEVEKILPDFGIDIDTTAKTPTAHLKIIRNRCIEKIQQENPPAENEDKKAEYSKAMSKQRMMTALKIESYETFNSFAKRHGLKKINRKVYQIRTDTMTKPEREKLKNA